MVIRKAEEKDLNGVEAIYNKVLEHEASTISYTNWQKGLYPTRTDAEKAFAEGTLFVGEEEGEIFGSVILNHVQPKEYENISWEIPALGAEVLVIHTLCIPPDSKKKGYGRAFVAFAEEYARSLQCHVIRLDTYEGNKPAIGLYSKLGYRLAGKCLFHFQKVIWETLVCMEKDITPQ